MFNLNTSERKKGDDVSILRKEGLIPAVIYGAKEEATSCSVTKSEFIKVWREAGETGMVELKTSSGNRDVMIHVVQRDPISDAPIHIDFYAVTKGQKIEVAVPLEFVGVSPAVKELGAILITSLREVLILGDARSIPQEISVDIETLVGLDSQIVASDLVLPEGVELVTGLEEVVVSVTAANEEEVDVVEEVDMAAIEVEQKGKKEGEEGEEGAAAPAAV